MKIKGYTFEVTILNKRELNEILLFTKRKLSSDSNLISKTEVVLKNSLELEDQLVFIKYNNSGIEVYRNSFIIPKIEIGTISIRYEIEEQKESYYLRYTKQNQNDSTINDSTTKRYYSFEYEDFNELELIPPVGIPVTNLRIWKSPLKEIELERHSRDIFNWGTEFPNDESYISKEIQTNSDPEFVKDFFSEEFEFPENSRTYQINSRKNKILEFALESFMLRNQTTKWVDIVKNQEIDIDLNKIKQIQIFSRSLDSKWDESSQNEGVRIFDEIKNEISSVEQPVADWRFGIEYSPNYALDLDQMRGLSSFNSINEWVGNPELLYTQRYPALEDWRDSYFNRTEGPLKYLKAMKLHRWINANLRGLIEKLIPFNVNYLGFNNVIEPHASERTKIKYPGVERHLDPLGRLDPTAFRVLILSGTMRRM